MGMIPLGYRSSSVAAVGLAVGCVITILGCIAIVFQ